ncbi:MAG: pyrroline-5-carboxylate reductase [Sphaerochaeta sp.]|jgi:pyrroline-5-carboxylate reductase|uniref:pyrroline-5-carboxylate reductase n=1 Tax=Sphaerochaeta sp. TaxID=1972642 RepID=UPI002FCA03EF
MQQLGIIGCGNMGGAIAKSLGRDVLVYDSDQAKAQAFAKEAGLVAVASLKELFSQSSCLLLAVKPQILPSLYPELRALGSDQKAWISIAAGVPLMVLHEELGTDEVVRFMPNIAAQMRSAVTAIAPLAGCSDAHIQYAKSVAEAFGSAFLLPESQFAAFIGISGSAIAYVLQFFHALAMGGVVQGIAYPQALQIAIDTAASAVALAKHTQKNPVELATMVCSAGGTTIEGMQALAEGGFDATVMQAVQAASEKSRFLEQHAQTNPKQ